MSDTARTIYADAPLGSIIAFADGTPRPPDRFRRKLRDWQNSNGRGRLVARAPAWRAGAPDTFTLHLGDYHGSQGVKLIVLNCTYTTDSALTFAVARPPEPGTVQVVTEREGHEELVHRASTVADAEAWATRNYYRNPRIVVAGEPALAEAQHVVA